MDYKDKALEAYKREQDLKITLDELVWHDLEHTLKTRLITHLGISEGVILLRVEDETTIQVNAVVQGLGGIYFYVEDNKLFVSCSNYARQVGRDDWAVVGEVLTKAQENI